MTEKFSLKDQLFNQQKVGYLASRIKNVYPQFEEQQFNAQILQQFPALELKQRISCIRMQLEKQLPNKFESALTVILNALPAELDPSKTDDDFGDFIFAPLSDFVAKNGLQKQYLSLSFKALAEITKRFSCEDSIRYFINAYPEESWVFMQQMSQSDNYHQRRLASEGLRPKLPWCIGINIDYQKPLILLSQLHNDDTRYVVRSVANHLNDIAKIDASLVIQTLKKWQIENKQSKKEWDFLSKHALRTLVKKGNKSALKLLGFNANPKITVPNFNLKKSTLCLGDYLDFSFVIDAQKEENLMIDYKIIYPTTHQRVSEKVFKIKQLSIKQNTCITVHKKHLFRLMSTKKLHAGKYQIHLQINGNIFGKAYFILNV
ncbi:DNA alkylation repair enzyme [hydrothermal vent metagenome]|uniref:DNA alkylation repair enzyme n=1 Tax=hydrothermal vent metagenome TaxID=652676 RepID=A0A1W1DVD8_9ZZZZ